MIKISAPPHPSFIGVAALFALLSFAFVFIASFSLAPFTLLHIILESLIIHCAYVTHFTLHFLSFYFLTNHLQQNWTL